MVCLEKELEKGDLLLVDVTYNSNEEYLIFLYVPILGKDGGLFMSVLINKEILGL